MTQPIYWEVIYLNGMIAIEDTESQSGDGGYYAFIHQRHDIHYLSLIVRETNDKYTFNMQTGELLNSPPFGTFTGGKQVPLTHQDVYYEPIQFKGAMVVGEGENISHQTLTYNIGWKADFGDFHAKAILSIDALTLTPTLHIR